MRFGVSKRKEIELAERMRRLSISEDDITERFIRPGGPGGQKSDKTSSTVHLRHETTGISIKCGRERSRAVNRYLARRLLADRIEEEIAGKKSERRKRIEKIRRRKRKRSARAKEKVLREKKKQSAKKEQRSKSFPED